MSATTRVGTEVQAERAGDLELVDRLVDLGREVSRALATAAEGVDVPVRQVQALCRLRHGPRHASDLAVAVGHSRSSATELVDRLGARGLVERRPDPHDRRRLVVALTPTGQRLADEAYRAVDDELLPRLGRLSPALRRQFAEALGMITDDLP